MTKNSLRLLPNKSEISYADKPSKEFSYTYLNHYDGQMGPFYRTAQDALKGAQDDYFGFKDGLSGKTVYVIQILGFANAGE